MNFSEATLRLSLSLGIFLLMALWEVAAPVRALSARKPKRWMRNISIAVINALVVRLVAPAGAVGVAWWAETEGWGLFTEQLMFELGFLHGDDVKLTQLRNRLWRASRVI